MALWSARQATITVGNAIAAVSTTQNFKTQLDAVGTNEQTIEKVTKNCEFKEPEISTNEVKLLGSTSGNQNQELDPQAPTKGEFTATMLMNPEDDNDIDLEQFKLTADTQPPSGYTRYNYASAAPSAGVGIVVTMNAGSGKPIVHFLLNNATIETLGGMKVDAEGHSEQEIKITSASDDCWKEFDVDGGN